MSAADQPPDLMQALALSIERARHAACGRDWEAAVTATAPISSELSLKEETQLCGRIANALAAERARVLAPIQAVIEKAEQDKAFAYPPIWVGALRAAIKEASQ